MTGNADLSNVPMPRRGSRSGTGGTSSRPGAFPALAALLWTVRESLELVLYRLVVARLVVTDGSPRWLPRADAELHEAIEQLSSTEVLRAAEVHALGAVLGTRIETLAGLTASAPAPWPDLFAEHRSALLDLLDQIERAVTENRVELERALSAQRSHRVQRPTASAGPREEANTSAVAALRSALVTLDLVPQLSLQDFLA